jgi:hypothetical protein
MGDCCHEVPHLLLKPKIAHRLIEASTLSNPEPVEHIAQLYTYIPEHLQ